MSIITNLKSNYLAFLALTSEVQRLCQNIDKGNFLVLKEHGEFEELTHRYNSLSDGLVYRLKSDYVCTHPLNNAKADYCRWCNEKISKEAEIEVCPVSVSDRGFLKYKRNDSWSYISNAPGVKGFLFFNIRVGNDIFRTTSFACASSNNTIFPNFIPNDYKVESLKQVEYISVVFRKESV